MCRAILFNSNAMKPLIYFLKGSHLTVFSDVVAFYCSLFVIGKGRGKEERKNILKDVASCFDMISFLRALISWADRCWLGNIA